MIALSTFNYDEIAKSNKYILSLPTNRNEIVKAKFILAIASVIIGGIIGIIITIIVINIINYIKPEDIINIDYRGLIISTVGGMFGIALIQSIQIPSIYKMGSRKRKNSNVCISFWYGCNYIWNSFPIYENERSYKYRNNRKSFK